MAKQDDTARRELRELRGLEVEAILVLGVARSSTVNSRSQAADQLPDLPAAAAMTSTTACSGRTFLERSDPRPPAGGRAVGAA